MIAVALAAPAPAGAALIQERGGLQSATNGIVLGPDGNFWIAEYVTGNVVRLSPGGAVLGRFAVGAGPTSLATGPGGRVWVSVTGADKLTWIDALAASPTTHDIAVPGGCGPVGIADGGNGRMYVSIPDDGCGTDRLGWVSADGNGAVTTVALRGRVFDLAVAGGKLFAPDFGGDVVRRIALDDALTVETSVAVSNNPDGVTVDGAGTVWVTQYSGGRVSRFPASQNGGAGQEVVPMGGTLTNPFGIVAGADGRIYVTGHGSANLARITPGDGSYRFYDVGDAPWQIVNGPDGDLFFTDLNSTRIVRFLSAAPRATTGTATAAGATSGSASASVDPRGNDTQVVFDYGPTPAYGATSTPVTLPAGDGAVPVTAVLTGLVPSTTYHVRVRAANEEGSVSGAATTFTTAAGVVDADGDGVSPPLDCNDASATIRPGAADRPGDKVDQDCSGADAAFPVLAARATFSWAFVGSRTLLTRVRITDLRGGETVRVACSGRSCPFKSKTYRNVRAGRRSLNSLFGRKRSLRRGVKVTVRITAPDAVGSSTVLTVRNRRQDPRIVRRAVSP